MAHILLQHEQEKAAIVAAAYDAPAKQFTVTQQLQSQLDRGRKRPVWVPLSSAEQTRRSEELSLLYYKSDLEGLGYVDTVEIRRNVQSFVFPGSKPDEMRTKFDAAQARGAFPDEGLDRESFITRLLQITEHLNASEFNEFIAQCHENMDFLGHLTEAGRRRQAVFQLFVEWDADASGVLEYDEMATVIINTKFFLDRRWDITRVASYFLPRAQVLPRRGTAEMDAFLRKIKQENPGLNLQQFNKFVNHITRDLEANDFWDCINQMRRAITYQKKEYTVGRYMAAGLRADRSSPDVPRAPSPSGSRPKQEIGDVIGTMMRDKDRRAKRIAKLRQELKHSLDAINLDDVVTFVDTVTPPPAYEKVATAICVLFRLPPALEDVLLPPHFSALKQLMLQDVRKFVMALCMFNTTKVKEPQIRRVMWHFFDPEFDPLRLVTRHWFLAALCDWVRKVVHIVCLENGWSFPPPRTEAHMELARDSKEETEPLTALEDVMVPQPKQKKDAEASIGFLPVVDTVFQRGGQELVHHSPRLSSPVPQSPNKEQWADGDSCKPLLKGLPPEPASASPRSIAAGSLVYGTPSPQKLIVRLSDELRSGTPQLTRNSLSDSVPVHTIHPSARKYYNPAASAFFASNKSSGLKPLRLVAGTPVPRSPPGSRPSSARPTSLPLGIIPYPQRDDSLVGESSLEDSGPLPEVRTVQAQQRRLTTASTIAAEIQAVVIPQQPKSAKLDKGKQRARSEDSDGGSSALRLPRNEESQPQIHESPRRSNGVANRYDPTEPLLPIPPTLNNLAREGSQEKEQPTPQDRAEISPSYSEHRLATPCEMNPANGRTSVLSTTPASIASPTPRLPVLMSTREQELTLELALERERQKTLQLRLELLQQQRSLGVLPS
eukprot:TRINITY_DN12543_c0_g1_i1.p1 TRINITY_DN12543_c0_g1~~TRINITY_DN12543_c0_g1_i1.p1  ORF type:complete len:890 (-),score=152.91 TRINITY_DN12543_c0_g1_i1:4-2673(-)